MCRLKYSGIITLAATRAFGLASVLTLAACSTAPARFTPAIDCKQPVALCHEGRFGLTYRIDRQGQVEEDAVNGVWRWESLNNPADASTTRPAASLNQSFTNTEPGAVPYVPVRLELSNVLGVRLATVEQGRRQLLLTDGQGRQYVARDWDDLFLTLFELRLPGEAIARWMGAGAKPDTAPDIQSAGWTSTSGPRRLRLQWTGREGQIRLDLIPDTASP